MADIHNIRKAFRNFIGAERFNRFVSQTAADAPKRKIRFWQEHCWREFVAQVPGIPTNFDDFSIFIWCPVHEKDLEAALARTLPLEIRKSDALRAALKDRFPFALGQCCCPECSAEFDTWVAENDCQILRRKTTWAAYLAAHEFEATPEVLKTLQRSKSVIETDMLEDDELWEWDGGDGTTGLAILRGGEIKTLWSAPIKVDLRFT